VNSLILCNKMIIFAIAKRTPKHNSFNMRLLKKYKQYIINFIGITFFAVILSSISLEGCITSLSDLVPSGRELDFKSSDFYQLVADARAEKVLDDKIVIVPIDKLSRKDICHLIEDVALASPQAIGLDVFFLFPMEGDEHLIEVLRRTPNMVLAMGVYRDESSRWNVKDTYLSDSLQNSIWGVVNMNVKRRYHVVRDFIPQYQTNRGVANHFALSLASHANPSKANQLQSLYHGKSDFSLPIDYTSREFDIIEPDDILEHIDDLKGKIVMIGALDDSQDVFITPVDDTMPGIMVHAYTLSTILRGQYSKNVPQWILWLLGLSLCILFVIVKMWLKRHSLENLLMRMFQICIMFAITYFGCVLFINYHYTLELATPLLLVALGCAALDVWDDIINVIPKIFDYMIKHILSKIHLLGLVILFTMPLQAATFRIYKVEGDVRILKNEKWVVPQVHQQLSVGDQFMIGTQGRLAIVANETHRIYYSVNSGKQNVAQIISAARKQSDRIASNMNKQLASNKQMKDSSLPILGGVNRGNQQEDTSTSLVYAAIYKYLRSQDKKTSSLITADLVLDGDSYYFKASNQTNKQLYANIIRVPLTADEHPRICMEVGYTMNEPFLVMGARQETSWNDYRFLVEEPFHQYLLFASEQPYDCQVLQMMLSTMSPPTSSNQKEFNVHLYLIK